MTKFFNIFKKTVFDPFLVHFPNFGGKNFFLENPALSHTTSYGFLALYQNLEKTNDTNSKQTPGQMEGQKDGWKGRQTILHRTLLANARDPNK